METPSTTHIQYFRDQMQQFTTFTDREWSIFTDYLYLKRFSKKELFVEEGKICQEIAFIGEGSFRLYFTKEGVQINNYFCFSGDLISAYSSFLRQNKSFINIEAMQDSLLICISSTGMKEMMEHPILNPRMETFRREIAEYLICCYEDRLLAFIGQTPEERYQELLLKQPGLFQKIPQHYIANFLGITPVSLSRIRKRILQQAKIASR